LVVEGYRYNQQDDNDIQRFQAGVLTNDQLNVNRKINKREYLYGTIGNIALGIGGVMTSTTLMGMVGLSMVYNVGNSLIHNRDRN